MTSSLTHLPTPPSFFLAIPHPPLPPFFLLALPTLPEPLPTLFRRLAEDALHQSEARKIFVKYGRKGPMRQHNEILRFDDVIASGR